jgi:aminopeptidase N
VHGIFGNNEWAEGWLDEGFSSFLGNWYSEREGADRAAIWRNTIQGIARAEQAGQTQPISMKSADFRDFGTYNAMTYTKPSIVYNMLRWVVGDDAFRRALRGYFEVNRLRHVRDSDFRTAVEAAHGADLGWFFDQWIHTTKTLDYRLGEVTTTQTGNTWTTRVEIIRVGEAWMPVDLKVGDVTRRLDSRDARFTATVVTRARPAEVVLDPLDVLLDLDVANNRKAM